MFEYFSATQPTVGMQNSNNFPLINTPKYQFIIYFLYRFDELCVLINAQMHVHSMLVKVNAEIQTITNLYVYSTSLSCIHTQYSHEFVEKFKKNAIEFPCSVPISVFTVNLMWTIISLKMRKWHERKLKMVTLLFAQDKMN